jgi:UrcA family protein
MDTSTGATRSARKVARFAALTLAAGACSIVGAVAMAQNSSEDVPQSTVTVQAPRVVRHNAIGTAGISVQQMTLVRVVSFADLNLDTPEGKVALHERIRDNARQACEQMATLYPDLIWIDDVQTCVHNAMLTWMPRVHAVSGLDPHSTGAQH